MALPLWMSLHSCCSFCVVATTNIIVFFSEHPEREALDTPVMASPRMGMSFGIRSVKTQKESWSSAANTMGLQNSSIHSFQA
ncbi:hypothetical protein KSC_060300 [Ktedonobacter sp. SOSP1-52]|nr:hypothetical protein KSC_060300 [Ktedonobacter sp. SOSP1-52]